MLWVLALMPLRTPWLQLPLARTRRSFVMLVCVLKGFAMSRALLELPRERAKLAAQLLPSAQTTSYGLPSWQLCLAIRGGGRQDREGGRASDSPPHPPVHHEPAEVPVPRMFSPVIARRAKD